MRDRKSRSERDVIELEDAGEAAKRVLLEDPEPCPDSGLVAMRASGT